MPPSYQIIDSSRFDQKLHGSQVSLYTLVNAAGCCVQITNFGARIIGLWLPDQNGVFDDVVLGYDALSDYLSSKEIYFGAAIGCYANRIANAHFLLNDVAYRLHPNDGNHYLHGGTSGFHQVIWTVEQQELNTLKLSHISPAGEAGFPGNLHVELVYRLNDENELLINYTATTDAPTPVSLTHHSYFNLQGAGSGSIDQHVMTIHADQYLAVNEELIPTGKFIDVHNSAFDFRTPKAIGRQIELDDALKINGGFDHCFVLPPHNNELLLAASVVEPISGRTLEVETNAPGVQFYTSNHFDGSIVGKKNKSYIKRAAFCLECQSLPNSLNENNFPNTILAEGETYESTCIYRFGVIN